MATYVTSKQYQLQIIAQNFDNAAYPCDLSIRSQNSMQIYRVNPHYLVHCNLQHLFSPEDAALITYLTTQGND